jgi:pimeloyl-ACP methyl ester carboxylesterase
VLTVAWHKGSKRGTDSMKAMTFAVTLLIVVFSLQVALAARLPVDTYDYQENAEGMNKCVRLAIPKGFAVVRGIVINGNAAGADTRDAYKQVWYEEFLDWHGFAFVGTKEFSSHKESFEVLMHALRRFAEESRHPELVHAPFVTVGFSAGGGFASRLVIEAPERVIAAAICSSFLRAEPSRVTLNTPICILSGELEPRLMEALPAVVSDYRSKDGRLSWLTIQGQAHQWTTQYTLALPFLDTAVRLRYPAEQDPRHGPVRLTTIPVARGWLADNTSWKSGLTKIAPPGEFTAKLATSSWLPNDDIAFIYRAYASYANPLKITSPVSVLQNGQVLKAGASVTIAVDTTRFPKWKALEFFDGGQRLGEVRTAPAQLMTKDLAAGYHVLSALGTDANGEKRCSPPVLIVVRKPDPQVNRARTQPHSARTKP